MGNSKEEKIVLFFMGSVMSSRNAIVCPVQVCLKLSIFIFLAQIFVLLTQHSASDRQSPSQDTLSCWYKNFLNVSQIFLVQFSTLISLMHANLLLSMQQCLFYLRHSQKNSQILNPAVDVWSEKSCKIFSFKISGVGWPIVKLRKRSSSGEGLVQVR